MSQREQPPCVSPFIFNNTKHNKIKDGLHAFNSIVLDDKLRWYSEELSLAYFQNYQEYNAYIDIIGGIPMDYGTIRRKIENGAYKESSQLFDDMELVFINAMRYNNPTVIWYTEAERLLQIVKSLRRKKKVSGITKSNQDIKYNPATEQDEYNVRSCTQCNNIMIPKRMSQPKRCGACSTNIRPSSPVYVCYNHADKQHEFCNKCVAVFCRSKCQQWHIGKRCPKSSKRKSIAGLRPLDLDVPVLSYASHQQVCNCKDSKSIVFGYIRNENKKHCVFMNIEIGIIGIIHKYANCRFEKLKIDPIIGAKLENMINIMRKYDPDGHFWNDVHHPEYLHIIKKPIHFGHIVKKLERKKYSTIKDIKNDIDLLWENCYKFNGLPNPDQPVTSSFANFASELQWTLNEYLEQFNQILCKRGYICNDKKKRNERKRTRVSENETLPKRKKRKLDICNESDC